LNSVKTKAGADLSAPAFNFLGRNKMQNPAVQTAASEQASPLHWCFVRALQADGLEKPRLQPRGNAG
jgi:hypothetical protein